MFRLRNVLDAMARPGTSSAHGAGSLALSLTVAGVALLGPTCSWAEPAARPQVIYPDRTDVSGPLREMPVLPDQAGRKYLPRKDLAGRLDTPAPIGSVDPVLDEAPAPATGTTELNFDGVSNRNGVLPPDTNGDIGPNHYVQWVNLSLQIWSIDRSARTATSVYGPVNGNTIWSGFGGPCQTTNNGDPIVLYDQAADRWMISQFALPNYPNGPFYQCVAVSQSPDPTAGWFRYQFTVSQNKMNDYPHLGVWPDGYYMSFNQFNAGSLRWGGQGVAVFERAQMLKGLAARMVYFDLNSVDANLGGMLPADLDGATAPPADAPNVFVEFDDDAWGYSPDQLQYWNFHVDWTTPANSSFTKGGSMETSPFDANLCGYARNCVPQPGTAAKLDAISDRLMYRLQYRNFGSYEALVTNHTVDADGTDRAGVRWYELRRSGGNAWSIYQQGTFSPDSTDRWMGSAAMNGAGQIALGYSISSGSIYPSIRYTGRLASDPLGTMSQGENTIVDGSGSQTHTAYRWGDYSSMSVDPTDDCAFWYTTEYIQTTGSAPWQTRIASFRFQGCSGTVDLPPTVSITDPAQGEAVSGEVTVTADATDDNGVSQVAFYVDGASIGTDTVIADGWSVTWNTIGYDDGNHTVTATAADTISQTASDTHTVTVNNVPDPVLHVGDLDGTRASVKNNWKATVTVTVHDAADAVVSGAVVSGSWSGGYSGAGTCTTNPGGTCSVSSGNIPGKKTSVTFTVTNVTQSGASYNASANHDPDGDSNGTSITILK